MRFKNKVVLITGAAKGIGKSTAMEFAKEGANVVINYLHSGIEANKLVSDIKKFGSDAIAIKADVSKFDEVSSMMDTATKRFGKIDILVNNAGVITRPGDYEKMSEADFNRTIDVNLKGTYNCIRAVIPIMKKQKGGRIVNIAPPKPARLVLLNPSQRS